MDHLPGGVRDGQGVPALHNGDPARVVVQVRAWPLQPRETS